MNHIPPSVLPEESRKFPVATLLGAIVILAAAVAILVFDVPVGTVLIYGLLGLMLFGHFFMHAGHGAHDEHSQGAPPSEQNSGHTQTNSDSERINEHYHADQPAKPVNPETDSEKDKDSHQGHSGC